MRVLFLLLVLSVFSLSSCERIPKKTEEQFRVGMRAVQEEDWGKAQTLLEKALEGELPPQKEQEAKLALADAYFNDENFEEAALNYEEFLELYPASPHTREALFRLGVCYINLVKGPEWDQTFTEKAYKVFSDFLKRFPDDALAPKAEYYRKVARKILAEHEVYIGGTYDMFHKFTASIERYKDVEERFADVEGEDRLKYLIGRAYFFTNVQSEEEIDRLRRKLEKEEKRLKSDDPDERRVARNRIELIRKDIKKWEKLAKENRKVGEKILKELIAKYPSSPYAVKARKILSGEVILDVEPVINPLKRSLWWKIRKTL